MGRSQNQGGLDRKMNRKEDLLVGQEQKQINKNKTIKNQSQTLVLVKKLLLK